MSSPPRRRFLPALTCWTVALVIVGAACVRGEELSAWSTLDAGSVALRYPSEWGRPLVANVAACPLESPTDVPDGVAPAHLAIVFGGLRPVPKEHVQACNFPNFDFSELRVFPTAEYSKIWAEATQPLEELKRIVRSGAPLPHGEIPYIPFVDAHPAFTEHVVALPFEHGRGVAFLTQWMIEPDAIGGQLVYIFQGLSTDGRLYVLGTFPVKYRGALPSFPVPRDEHIEQTQARYEPYATEVTRILGSAAATDFAPSLEDVLALLRTLRVR